MRECEGAKQKRKLEHAGPLHFERFTSERKTLRTPEKSKNQAKKLMTPLLVNHGGKLPSERYVIR